MKPLFIDVSSSLIYTFSYEFHKEEQAKIVTLLTLYENKYNYGNTGNGESQDRLYSYRMELLEVMTVYYEQQSEQDLLNQNELFFKKLVHIEKKMKNELDKMRSVEAKQKTN